MVPIHWLRQIKKVLKQPMDGGISKQIFAADHVRNAAGGVI